jgi:nitrate/nitrite transporter NarK
MSGWPKATAAGAAQEQAIKDANKEAAAVLGFSAAIGAYGGFFIPKSYGTSIALTGGPDAALYASSPSTRPASCHLVVLRVAKTPRCPANRSPSHSQSSNTTSARAAAETEP